MVLSPAYSVMPVERLSPAAGQLEFGLYLRRDFSIAAFLVSALDFKVMILPLVWR